MSNKSEATWHPNNVPEVPHADLIARLRDTEGTLFRGGKQNVINTGREAANALAALGDTVPRAQYDAVLTDRNSHKANVGELLVRSLDAERERDEARAERDALAARDAEFVRLAGVYLRASDSERWPQMANKLRALVATTPAVSLALHDAEVWDEGVRAKSASSSIFDADVFGQNPYREEAN